MPTIDDQYDAALAKLRLHIQPDVPPTLTEAELEELLLGEQRLSQWEDTTEYEYGQVIGPTVRNGHRYRCIQAGTSGATEPTWLTSTGAVLSEGESDPQLKWVEDGPDYANAFDVRAAIHAAAEVKKHKAAALYAAGNAHMEQVFEHWQKIAESNSSLKIA